MIEIGSIITQSSEFYNHWNTPKFKRKVIDIHNKIIFLNEDVVIENYTGRIHITKYFHSDYLQLDLSDIRKQKLKKLNERI